MTSCRLSSPHRDRRMTSAALALALILVFEQSCSRPDGKTEIRLGLLCALSGESAVDGGGNRAGAELAVSEVNREGGLTVGGKRHRLVLVGEDTASTAENAVRAARKLINQDDVAALVGPFATNTAIPVAAMAEQSRVPMISPSASNPRVTAGKEYVFRGCFTDEFQGRMMAGFARQDLAARKAAVLYDVTDAYGVGLAEIFRREFENGGRQVVSFETFLKDDRDFTQQLTRIAAQQPDVLFLPGYTEVVRLQARQARQLGITATFLGTDGWNETALAGLPEMADAYKGGHWYAGATDERVQRFVEAFREAYGSVPDLLRAGLAYDATKLLLHAIEKQDSFESDRIRDGLAGLSGVQGITGTVSFHGSGDPEKGGIILRFSAGAAVLHKRVHP